MFFPLLRLEGTGVIDLYHSSAASCMILGPAEDNNVCDCGNRDFSFLLFSSEDNLRKARRRFLALVASVRTSKDTGNHTHGINHC